MCLKVFLSNSDFCALMVLGLAFISEIWIFVWVRMIDDGFGIRLVK